MERGARLQYQAPVKAIRLAHGVVKGVILKSGEEIECDRIVFNGDANALATGLLGDPAAQAIKAHDKSARSLSAVTWAAAVDTAGFPLARHNVFFSRDYKAEFEELREGYPTDPTIYICAQDRDDSNDHESIGRERLLILVNSPANGDGAPMPHAEIENAMRRKLNDCGLALDWQIDKVLTTTPHGFAGLFPATGGALYGRASHGWLASFQRPGAATKIKGLYLAGGSTHPGPGVPMAALSGRLAAERLLASRGSMQKYPSMVIAGGTSTR
jgi:1-hydroxycarotenoid 3,4-desaturase